MTEEQVKKKLLELQLSGDTEQAHADADDLLCEFLKSLGYSDIAGEFEKVPKWYA